MNASRNLRIDFRVNGKHDHYIQKERGKSVTKRATKARRHIVKKGRRIA